MQIDLFNLMIGGGKYNINYATVSFPPTFTSATVTNTQTGNIVTLTNIKWHQENQLEGKYNDGTFYGYFNPINNNFICYNYKNITGIVTSASYN